MSNGAFDCKSRAAEPVLGADVANIIEQPNAAGRGKLRFMHDEAHTRIAQPPMCGSLRF